MPDEFKNIGEEYQRLGKDGFDAIVRSFAEMNKGFQAIGAEMTSYSKKAFDEGMNTWEQLLCVRSIDEAVEIQSQYAKRAYDNHVAEVTKLGEMCSAVARNASAPVQKPLRGRAPNP
jgi:hypothetical protein